MNPDLEKKIRPSAWAGAFYPDKPAELRLLVQQLLAKPDPMAVSGKLLGIVVPHAGYIYSGETAAHGYRLLQDTPVKTVFIIAPSHAEWFDGVSVYGGDFYETPLGRVAIDKERVEALTGFNDLVKVSESGHHVHGERAEHSLEVQLPFLQVALTQPYKIVAIVFHDYRPEVCRTLGKALANVFEDSDLMVASTDLYHGYSYKGCLSSDEKTVQAMQSLDVDAFCKGVHDETYQACGAGPVAALLYAAKEKKADTVQLLHRSNSADRTGSVGGWTVGYASLSVSRCLNA